MSFKFNANRDSRHTSRQRHQRIGRLMTSRCASTGALSDGSLTQRLRRGRPSPTRRANLQPFRCLDDLRLVPAQACRQFILQRLESGRRHSPIYIGSATGDEFGWGSLYEEYQRKLPLMRLQISGVGPRDREAQWKAALAAGSGAAAQRSPHAPLRTGSPIWNTPIDASTSGTTLS